MFDSLFDGPGDIRALFNRVRVEREVRYTLFTFGDSELEYYLVVGAKDPRDPVAVTRGQVTVTRPTILTPGSRPELFGFFEEDTEGEEWKGEDLERSAVFMMSRTAAFQNMNLSNRVGKREAMSDSVEEVVERLGRRLDSEDEDRVAILSAPHGLGPVAVLKYTTEQIGRSTPGNIKELQEKGLLP